MVTLLLLTRVRARPHAWLLKRIVPLLRGLRLAAHGSASRESNVFLNKLLVNGSKTRWLIHVDRIFGELFGPSLQILEQLDEELTGTLRIWLVLEENVSTARIECRSIRVLLVFRTVLGHDAQPIHHLPLRVFYELFVFPGCHEALVKEV